MSCLLCLNSPRAPQPGSKRSCASHQNWETPELGYKSLPPPFTRMESQLSSHQFLPISASGWPILAGGCQDLQFHGSSKQGWSRRVVVEGNKRVSQRGWDIDTLPGRLGLQSHTSTCPVLPVPVGGMGWGVALQVTISPCHSCWLENMLLPVAIDILNSN